MWLTLNKKKKILKKKSHNIKFLLKELIKICGLKISLNSPFSYIIHYMQLHNILTTQSVL